MHDSIIMRDTMFIHNSILMDHTTFIRGGNTSSLHLPLIHIAVIPIHLSNHIRIYRWGYSPKGIASFTIHALTNVIYVYLSIHNMTTIGGGKRLNG